MSAESMFFGQKPMKECPERKQSQEAGNMEGS